jgi:hypothetical protein
MLRAWVGRRRRSGWLRECPPACGLLLDFATPPTALPSASSIGSLRRTHTNPTCRIRLVGCSAQRHKGGGQRPGDSRSAECPSGLILTACRAGFGMSSFWKRAINKSLVTPAAYGPTRVFRPGAGLRRLLFCRHDVESGRSRRAPPADSICEMPAPQKTIPRHPV